MNKLKLCSKSKILPAFINDPNVYCYHKSCHDKHMLIAIEDRLFITDYSDNIDPFEIVRFGNCIAYVDRNDKIIKVFTGNSYLYNNISKYVSGYKVYPTNYDKINTINDTYSLINGTITWFVDKIYNVQYHTEFEVLAGKKQTYYGNRDKFADPIDTNNPINNVNYLRAFRKWLEVNKCVNSVWTNHTPRAYTIIAGKRIICKTVGEIYKNGIFTKDEEETLRKRYFYSTNIRGRRNVEHISYEAMEAEWSLPFVVDHSFTKGAEDILSINVPVDDFNSSVAPVIVRANYIRYLLKEAKKAKQDCIARIKQVCIDNPVDVFRHRFSKYIDNVEYQYMEFVTNVETNAIDTVIVKCYSDFDDCLSNIGKVILRLSSTGNIIYTNTGYSIEYNKAKQIYSDFMYFIDNNDYSDHSVLVDNSTYTQKVIIRDGKTIFKIGCQELIKEDVEEFIDYYKLNDWREFKV